MNLYLSYGIYISNQPSKETRMALLRSLSVFFFFFFLDSSGRVWIVILDSRRLGNTNLTKRAVALVRSSTLFLELGTICFRPIRNIQIFKKILMI